jgi:hypothetical protein
MANFQRAIQKNESLIKGLDAQMRAAYDLDTEAARKIASELGSLKTLAVQLRAEIRSSAPTGRIA